MDIGTLWGALAVGIMLNLMLYGVMFVQCYIYTGTFGKRDPMWIRLFVAYLFIADTVLTAFAAAILYVYLIKHFDPAMTGIISFSVQLFFAYRVKRLTGNTWAAIFISAFSFASFCGSLGTTIAVHWWPEFSQFQKFKVVPIIWLTCGVIADVTITVVLVRFLRKQRTGFVATDDVIDRITRVTIQTGLLTSVVAIVDMILYLVSAPPVQFPFVKALHDQPDVEPQLARELAGQPHTQQHVQPKWRTCRHEWQTPGRPGPAAKACASLSLLSSTSLLPSPFPVLFPASFSSEVLIDERSVTDTGQCLSYAPFAHDMDAMKPDAIDGPAPESSVRSKVEDSHV
ncbi:hypothetical protein EW146_g9534 [Bondarzewia mesenterica]|uniref:DUF6534 domain-containing protein n=1 Tax=Bondarzewia mesenterica TaxID=1095465 RepID=A0A4S4L5C9_9AGAM|nr:hypothetical protein EW146_g9534 [Bondarzewia mesenterica]